MKSFLIFDGDAEQGGRATAVRWRIVGLLMAGSFMSWFNRVSMSVAGTERLIGPDGISATEMGFVYSALLLAYAVCMTPGGWFIDRYGAWTALLLVGVGSGLFVVLTGAVGWLADTAWSIWLALLVVRALTGVCMAPIYPASARIVAHWLPLRQRAWANGLVNAAAPAGIACTFVGFGTLIDLFGWPTAFVVTGLLTVLLAGAWLLLARDTPRLHPAVNAAELRLIASDEVKEAAAADRPGASAWLGLLRNRSLILLTLSYAAIGYYEYLFFFWTEHYFKDELRLGTERARLYATALNLAMAVGMASGGLLSDRLLSAWGYRWGRAAVPLVGLLLSAVLLGAGLAVQGPAAVAVCFALALLCLGACEGPCWATAVELGGRRGGTAAGIFNTGGNVGGLLAPVVTPWVGERWGWVPAIALSGLFCLLAAVLWLGIDARQRS
jgi:ACS family D-galactonate transporter-like MFS transporter